MFGESFRPRFDLVVNLLTAKAIIDKEITVHGGEQWRPFISVDDVTRAIMTCLSLPADLVGGEIYNTGDRDLNYQIIDVGKTVSERHPAAKLIIDQNADDRRNYFVDFGKIESQLGFRCDTNLARGVSEVSQMIERLELRAYHERRFHNLLTLS